MATNRGDDEICELESSDVLLLMTRHERRNSLVDRLRLDEACSLNLEIQPGDIELAVEHWAALLGHNEARACRLIEFEAEPLDQDIETEHIRVDCGKAVVREVFVLLDDAGDDLVVKLAHECVKLLEEVSPNPFILQALETVPIPGNISGMEDQIVAPEEFEFEPPDLLFQHALGILLVDYHPTQDEDRILGIDFD